MQNDDGEGRQRIVVLLHGGGPEKPCTRRAGGALNQPLILVR